MPRYSYVALDARGQESSGVIEAESQNDAVGQLRQSGYFPKTISEEGKGPKTKTKAPAKQAAAKKQIKIEIAIVVFDHQYNLGLGSTGDRRGRSDINLLLDVVVREKFNGFEELPDDRF